MSFGFLNLNFIDIKISLKSFNTTFKGWTPLMLAVRDGHEAIVKLLIKHGANVNEKNISGMFFISFKNLWLKIY